jgi:hypothetical protein
MEEICPKCKTKSGLFRNSTEEGTCEVICLPCKIIVEVFRRHDDLKKIKFLQGLPTLSELKDSWQ